MNLNKKIKTFYKLKKLKMKLEKYYFKGKSCGC